MRICGKAHRHFSRATLWIGLFCLTSLCGAQDTERAQHVSEHYVVDVFAGTEAAAKGYAELLEAAHAEYQQVLGTSDASDAERVIVRVLPDRESWLARLHHEGGSLPGMDMGVVYWHPTATVYVERQAIEYVTRSRILNGAFQALHAQAKPKHADLVRSWFVLGLADSMSLHHWNGAELQLGVQPLVSVPDLPEEALTLLDASVYDTGEALYQRLQNRAIRFAVVRYLLEGAGSRARKEFQKLALGRSGSKLTAYGYAEALGKPKQVSAKVADYLESHQQTFGVGFGQWAPIDSQAVEAFPEPGKIVACVARVPLDEISVAVAFDDATGASSPPRGGLTLDWVDDKDFVWAVLGQDGRLLIKRFREGRVEELQEIQIDLEPKQAGEPQARALATLRAVRHGQQVALVVAGQVCGRIDVQTGRMGLAAENAHVRFLELAYK